MQCRRRWYRNILRSTKNCFHSALHYANKYLFAAFWKNAKHFLELNYISTWLTHWVSNMDPRNTSASNKKNVTLDKGALSGKTFMEHVVKKMSKCNPTKFGNTHKWFSMMDQKGPTSSSGAPVAHPGCVSHHNYSSSHNRTWVSMIYTANNRSSSGWSFHKKRNDSQHTRCHPHLGPHYRPNWQDLIWLNNLYAKYISYLLSRLS